MEKKNKLFNLFIFFSIVILSCLSLFGCSDKNFKIQPKNAQAYYISLLPNQDISSCAVFNAEAKTSDHYSWEYSLNEKGDYTTLESGNCDTNNNSSILKGIKIIGNDSERLIIDARNVKKEDIKKLLDKENNDKKNNTIYVTDKNVIYFFFLRCNIGGNYSIVVKYCLIVVS